MARADVAARQLLDEGGWTSLPIDPQDIAEALGVVVVEAPMSSDMSGMLVREPTRIVIGVNNDHSPSRQRFTIAHEIGHLRLHKGRSMIMDSDVRVNFRDNASSLATDREEIEANRFAAALLMPEHMVRSWIAAESFDSAKELVEQLAVNLKASRQAVNFRLVNLGFFPTPVELD
ncbi:ImmA/IrrE family metallo-endopeptidase [Catenulispora rubra]|uniref:ImmA/IrrE family metallo-endopeptidase n=1 Tax=Catenulispora rubra TaxID=280293 RepID=UPI0018924B5D|nr:ImmA/IrrE family metallo-endopeptidase [Catenulispora rubra]